MNKLKNAWASDRTTVNGWMASGNSFLAEVMAAAGFDSLTVDMQHGFLDYSHLMGQIQAMRASGVVPMARVPWLEPGAIMKAMDAGALGIICPMVNTGEEAAELVSYMRYPPVGTRSYGPTRALYHHGPGYFAEANDNVLAFAMIETATAVDNLEDICGTEGLNGIYVGPSDLTLGLKGPSLRVGLDRDEPEMIDAIRHVLGVAQDRGLRAGIHCGSAAYAQRAADWGFNFVTISSEVGILAQAAREAVASVRATLGQDSTAADHAKGGY